jgi:arginine decarboxylase
VKIHVIRASGTGPTRLSAFDNALMVAGVSNYNLIHLSSVIPSGGDIVQSPFTSRDEEYGFRHYVVMSHIETDRPGESVCAGLGWAQGADGRGLFVEHAGATEDDVRRDINLSLRSMVEARPQYVYGEIQCSIVTAACQSGACCALVIALYKVEPW